jgi:hypothetical protein
LQKYRFGKKLHNYTSSVLASWVRR